MQSVLQRVILDNRIGDYLVCLPPILLMLLFRGFLSRSIARLYSRILKRTSWNIDENAFANLLVGPIHLFVVFLVTFIALEKLKLPSVLDFKLYHLSIRHILDSTGRGIIVVVFTWLLLRCIDFAALILEQKANKTPGMTDDQLVVFFKDFFKVLIVFLGILLLIRFTFNKSIITLLAGFGIVGAAIALSARESLENLIASFIIFFDKPFSHGDHVKIQHITGTVERIGLRSTRIRTDQKTYVTVPNKQMVDSILDNLSLRTQRKNLISLEISSSTPYRMVNELVTAIDYILLKRKDHIQTYSVVLTDISKNAFIIQVEYFTGAIAIDIYNDVKQEVNLSIIQVIEEMKIKLAGKEAEVVLN
jgi:MscS family membrane protein